MRRGKLGRAHFEVTSRAKGSTRCDALRMVRGKEGHNKRHCECTDAKVRTHGSKGAEAQMRKWRRLPMSVKGTVCHVSSRGKGVPKTTRAGRGCKCTDYAEVVDGESLKCVQGT